MWHYPILLGLMIFTLLHSITASKNIVCEYSTTKKNWDTLLRHEVYDYHEKIKALKNGMEYKNWKASWEIEKVFAPSLSETTSEMLLINDDFEKEDIVFLVQSWGRLLIKLLKCLNNIVMVTLAVHPYLNLLRFLYFLYSMLILCTIVVNFKCEM